MNKYTEFKKIKDKEEYNVYNKIYDIKVGRIKKSRVGRFMHWCLFPKPKMWFSNGCLKEISKFITKLYSRKNEK